MSGSGCEMFVVLFCLCRCILADNTFDYEVGVANQTVAVLGSSAVLPCKTKPPPNDSVTLVMWYKQTLNSPVYTFDNRKINNSATHWTDERRLGVEAIFRMNEQKEFSTLTLKFVKAWNEGLYRCRVDFKKTPTRNYIVNLTVIVPPTRLTIIDDKGSNALYNVIGPYSEGSTAMVACIVSGGSPPPKVTWWKENALIDDSSETLSDGSVKNTLILENLSRKHLNAVYTCQASNNNLSAPLSSKVTLNMILLPLWIKLQGQNRPMSAERTYVISCQVHGAHPSPVITWWKGNLKLKNYEKSDSNDGNSTISRLNFIPEASDDGKTLICRAESASSSSTPFQDSWKLNITYKPIAVLDVGKNINISAITDGVDVYFECKIKSNLPVHKVMWKRNLAFVFRLSLDMMMSPDESPDIVIERLTTTIEHTELIFGQYLSTSQSIGPLITNQTLVLQKVTRDQSGLYSCLGVNDEGEGESNSFYLDVKYSPICYPSQPSEYGVGRGELVRVMCEVEANPPHVQFFWRFNNTSGSTDLASHQIKNDGTRSVATFTPVTEFDYGLLYCWAENSLGFQQNPCVYKIIPAGIPDSLQNCTTSNQTTESISIRCNGGFDGGLRQKFAIEIRGPRDKLLANLSGDSPEFLIKDLASGFSYDVITYAFNAKGRSRTTEFVVYTLKDPDDQMVKLPSIFSLPPMICLLVGSMLVLTILVCYVLGCVRLLFRSNSDRKRYPFKSKDGAEKNPDIIPDKNDDSCAVEIISDLKGENKESELSLILQSSYNTEMQSDFPIHGGNRKSHLSNLRSSSLKKLNDMDITYAGCAQPCPPFMPHETPLLSNNRILYSNEHRPVRCCIHGLSRSSSISRF